MDPSKRRFKQQMVRLTGAAAAAALLPLSGTVVHAASVNTKTMNPADFHSVIVDVPATFHIRIGARTEVRMSAEPKVLKTLRVTSKDGELNVTTIGSFSTQKAVDIEITTPTLKSLTALGTSEVVIDQLEAERLRVTATGSTSVFINKMNLQLLSAHLKESSEVRAAGSATSQKIEINGSASYEGLELKSVSANLTVADSGSAEVYAGKRLDVKISDAGSVTYEGQPVITQSVTDAGSLDRQ